jgi:3-oxoacyl-[acyl-carrier protein] reductase
MKRAVVITGASKGLGREIALLFGCRGDRVLVNFLHDKKAADDIAGEIIQKGGEAESVRADVRIAAEARALMAAAVAAWGRVDLLVNNAGITQDSLLVRMPDEQWDNVLNTNLTGAFYCMRAAAEIMVKQGSGHIISIASIVGMQGREGQANYSASKAGLIGLTKAAAREFGPSNVKVNAVLPGYLPTSLGSTVRDGVRKRILDENALGRISNPAEVAGFIHHLSLMEHVSGQVFNLDSRII